VRASHPAAHADRPDTDLPEGWAVASLHECVDVLDHLRVPINSEERKRRLGPIPYYGATGQVGWIDDFLFNEPLALVGEDGAPFLDKSKPIAYLIGGKSWVNNHAHVLRARVGTTSNAFIKHFLDSFDFTDYVNGTTRLKLTQAALNSIPLALPPLVEQQRIVAQVEALLARVNAAREGLAKVPAILKRFRQSVLAAACSGRLTEEWRGSSAAEETWCRLPIVDIAAKESHSIQSGPFGSNLHHSEFCDRGRLVIGIDNVGDGRFLPGKQHRITEAKFRELVKYRARPLDVLVTVMATIGRCCVVPEDIEPAIITKHVYRITVDRSLMSPFFLALALRGGPDVIDQIQSQIRGQTRHGINGQILKSVIVPVPPLVEQHEIVRRVDAFFTVADAIERRVAATTVRAEKLTQAILAKAFRGELVPTEAELARREGRDYEPAAVLLELIRAERVGCEPSPRPSPRGRGRRRTQMARRVAAS
jgi:type I restriction enzyme S subunit